MSQYKVGLRLTEREAEKAKVIAAYIDGSAHEHPKTQSDIQLLCHGFLDQQNRIAELELEVAGLRSALEPLAELLCPDSALVTQQVLNLESLGVSATDRYPFSYAERTWGDARLGAKGKAALARTSGQHYHSIAAEVLREAAKETLKYRSCTCAFSLEAEAARHDKEAA